jgi:trimethylamine--corrinoid protein Co-methyltransferase
LWPAVMGHTNFIMHSAGWLEAGLAISPEKMLLDMENLAIFQHFLGGFEIGKETLALDMMAEVGPGGHHFGTEHTRARYSNAFYEPFLSSRLGWDSWQAAGSQDSIRRAQQLWRDMLARYETPPLDAAIKEALEEYVARRERELEGQELYI